MSFYKQHYCKDPSGVPAKEPQAYIPTVIAHTEYWLYIVSPPSKREIRKISKVYFLRVNDRQGIFMAQEPCSHH